MKDKHKCIPRYIFEYFLINNDTICTDCSDEEVYYIIVN